MREFKKGDEIIVESDHIGDYEAVVKTIGHPVMKKGKLLVTVDGSRPRWVDNKNCKRRLHEEGIQRRKIGTIHCRR